MIDIIIQASHQNEVGYKAKFYVKSSHEKIGSLSFHLGVTQHPLSMSLCQHFLLRWRIASYKDACFLIQSLVANLDMHYWSKVYVTKKWVLTC